jgi:D-sedoheptulose 7-phosphate isomerase
VSALAAGALAARIDDLADRRARASEALFADEAERIAVLCHRMAERFARGGRLLALGLSAQARSDARHVTVEFVHPVIVGKRALPALGLSREGGALADQAALEVEPTDMAIGFGEELEVGRAMEVARERGALTIGFGVDAEWRFALPGEDPHVDQELTETLYHVLWELVHVFFEHPGLLEGRAGARAHGTGASSFLYPFLAESEHDADAVLADVQRSVLLKAEEASALREETLREGREELIGAAATLGGRLARGGRLLALGNGGSATDAMDVVADLREPRDGRAPRRALDLTEDPAVITAIANDIGTDAIFSRQVIAHGRPEDVLLALSTSGNSTNVIDALAEARRRGLATIAMVGYGGGRVAAERLADHVVVTRSEHIPRIQEAQASAYHALVELLEAT